MVPQDDSVNRSIKASATPLTRLARSLRKGSVVLVEFLFLFGYLLVFGCFVSEFILFLEVLLVQGLDGNNDITILDVVRHLSDNHGVSQVQTQLGPRLRVSRGPQALLLERRFELARDLRLQHDHGGGELLFLLDLLEGLLVVERTVQRTAEDVGTLPNPHYGLSAFGVGRLFEAVLVVEEVAADVVLVLEHSLAGRFGRAFVDVRDVFQGRTGPVGTLVQVLDVEVTLFLQGFRAAGDLRGLAAVGRTV